jgi:hypothetical protein
MNLVWRIDINSGARASLVCGRERKQIWRPQRMSREDFLLLLPEGALIEDIALRAMLMVWE